MRTGNPPTSRHGAGAGTPPAIRQTSVDVPPMSKLTAFGCPLAAATAAAALTPAAGPDSNNDTGRSVARASGTRPPADVMTSTAGATPARRAR